MVRFSLSASVLLVSALATASIACSADASQDEPSEEKSSSSSDMKSSCLDTVKSAGDAKAQIEAAKKCVSKGFDVSDLGHTTTTTDANGNTVTISTGNTQVPVGANGQVDWSQFDFGDFDWKNTGNIDWSKIGNGELADFDRNDHGNADDAWGDFDWSNFGKGNTATGNNGTVTTPPGKVCSTQMRCTDGTCMCTGGSHKGQSCNGSIGSGAGSCSEICSDCQ